MPSVFEAVTLFLGVAGVTYAVGMIVVLVLRIIED